MFVDFYLKAQINVNCHLYSLICLTQLPKLVFKSSTFCYDERDLLLGPMVDTSCLEKTMTSLAIEEILSLTILKKQLSRVLA